MATDKKTRSPTIPDLTDQSPAGIRAWVKHVQEAIAMLAGTRSQTDDALLDAAVTFRDLIDQGFAIKAPAGSGRVVIPGQDEGAFSRIPPPAPTSFTVTRLPFNARLVWAPPAYSNHDYTEVWRSSTNNLSVAERVAQIPYGIAIYEDGYQSGQAWYYWIRFVSTAGVAGAFNAINGTSDNAQPGDVIGLTYTLEQTGIRLRWIAVADPDLAAYEIRIGASWESGTLLDEVRATSYLWKIQTSGTYRVWLRARDVTGYYSGSATAIDVTIAAPGSVSLGFVLSGENHVLSWAAIGGSFLIDYYEIRYGTTWDAGTLVTRAFSTTFIDKVSWAGVRRFWVAARDIAGNYGAPSSVDITIIAPAAVGNVRAEVIDNNVLLYWTAPSATLPIRTYEIRKGADFSTATVVGEKDGQFTTVFEYASGDYTYWIRAKDTAGTYGPASAVTAKVNQPPDFVLYSDRAINLSAATLSSAIYDGAVTFPFNTTETWDQHYTTRSWTNDADAITAGFPVYAQPAPTSGYIEDTYDYGVNVPATTVTVAPTLLIVAGSPTHSIQISHKLLSGDAWTDMSPGSTAFIATSFRYLKVRITATTSGGGVGLYRCSGINVRLNVKVRTDSGQGTANSGDAGGTTVNLNIAFVDLLGPPVIQPVGTTPIIAVVDFTDAPNPTSFKVLLFNTAGTRVTAAFSWTARGV